MQVCAMVNIPTNSVQLSKSPNQQTYIYLNEMPTVLLKYSEEFCNKWNLHHDCPTALSHKGLCNGCKASISRDI